jgi:L-lactate dehydrogenase
VKVFQDIVPKLVKAAPQAVIVVATDPPEPLVDVARRLAGHDCVMVPAPISTACASAFTSRRDWGEPGLRGGHVVGEHGTSSVFL